MSLKNSAGLVPRNNWDYGLVDLCKAIAGAEVPRPGQPSCADAVFGQHAFYTTSGRVSLYAILSSLNLPAGARIGVPLFCCPVVFDAIVHAGFSPCFLDITGNTYSLSADDLERKRKGLAAVIVVHMFGHPADMDALRAAAGPLPIIEDCAQALFSVYKGRQAGFMSTASFFSFRSGKYVSAGEGSAIFCHRPDCVEALDAMIASFPAWSAGRSCLHSMTTYAKSLLYQRPWYGLIGRPIGVRLDAKLNITDKTGFDLRRIAPTDYAIIKDRLPSFSAKIATQRRHARFYLDTITLPDATLPHEEPGCESNFFQFVLRLRDTAERDRLVGFLHRCGIDSAKYFDGLLDIARGQYGYTGGCPVSEQCSKTICTIPNYYTLSERDVARIADCVNAFDAE